MIEDQPVYSKIILHALAKYPEYTVIHRLDGMHILDVIREHQPQLLLLDYNLPGLNGIEIYDLVHSTEGMQPIPSIMVSAELPRAEIAQRNIPGLRKPCRITDLIQTIESTLAQTIS
jgi:CheY-like chemotaxis protein